MSIQAKPSIVFARELWADGSKGYQVASSAGPRHLLLEHQRAMETGRARGVPGVGVED